MTFIQELTEIQEQTNAIQEATKDILAIQEPKCSGVQGDCPNTPHFVIHNGAETTYHCRPCFEECVANMVLDNTEVHFRQTGKNEVTLL